MENAKTLARDIQVDIAKGLGIFFVILGHLISYDAPLFRWIFSFHMPLFFFLSGYVFKHNSENLGMNIKKTLCSLLIPYFFMCLLGLAVTIVCSKTILPEWGIQSVKVTLMQIFYFVQPESLHVGQIWFLFCLAIVQVFFVILKDLKLPEPIELLFAAFSFAIAAGLSYIYLKINEKAAFDLTISDLSIRLNDIPRPPLKLDSAFMAFFFFYLGNKDFEKGFTKNFKTLRIKNRILILSLLLTVNILYVILLNSTANIAENFYRNAGLYAMASITGIYFIFIFASLFEHSKVLEFFGKNSLSIFLFHSFFLAIFSLILIKFSNGAIHYGNIPLPICFIGMLFVAILSIPIPFIYNHTIGKLVKIAKNRLKKT